MRPEVERLKLYFQNGKITKKAIDTLYANSKLTLEEYNYIIGGN